MGTDRLREGERQVRLGQDRLAIKKAAEKTEMSRNYIHCFTRTPNVIAPQICNVEILCEDNVFVYNHLK